MLTTFRVLSIERDPGGTVLLAHVEPYTPNPNPAADPVSSPLCPAGQVSTLYLRFRSPAKLDRWRAALSLALSVAQARSEVDTARAARVKFADAEEARRVAESEREQAENQLKKEKKSWEKRLRGMFSAEEVQDVYQETADQLADAERKIKELQTTLANEKQTSERVQRELSAVRRETEGPVGEYNSLLLRHEDLCRKYEEQTRETLLLRALYEKELTAHRRLAALLRKQASENVNTIDALADAHIQGLLSPP
ncbi:hypothetical protein HKX48_005614, partial [Thoreauomyces humboldtii]